MTGALAIIKELQRWRFPLDGEKRTQRHIEAAFKTAGIEHRREVVLSPTETIDFLTHDGVGVEVKLKGQRREHLRQCERYCQHDEIKSLILATNAAMGFPDEINGKPCYLVSLGKAWLT